MSTHTIPAHRMRAMIRIIDEAACAIDAVHASYRPNEAAAVLRLVRGWLLEAAVTDVAIERENERAIERAGIS